MSDWFSVRYSTEMVLTKRELSCGVSHYMSILILIKLFLKQMPMSPADFEKDILHVLIVFALPSMPSDLMLHVIFQKWPCRLDKRCAQAPSF